MKKFLAIIMMLCITSTTLCIPAFATDVVLSISAQKKDGTIVKLEDCMDIAYGWSKAVKLAKNSDEMRKNSYDRIVVDLCINWTAKDDSFGSGDGFNDGAIHFPENTRVTLNINGYTIDRDLSDRKWSGEVIYVDEKADVIINNGTVTGGWSDTGAGGIHIKDGAKVTLNNVDITGNSVEDDHGSAIAIYGGAALTMIGGSLSHNLVYSKDVEAYGTLYVGGGSTVVLKDVTISDNDGKEGVALYIDDGKVTLNNCTIKNNETDDHMYSLICICDGYLIINGGEIKNNGDFNYEPCAMFLLYDDVKISISDQCKITENQTEFMFYQGEGSDVYCNINECEITDNFCPLYPHGYFVDTAVYTYTKCKFNNNNCGGLAESVFIGTTIDEISLINCDLGDTTFKDKQYIDFGDGSGTGSIFGEGSLTMIVSVIALIASVASIIVNVSSKNKTVPETTNSTAKSDNKE